MVSRRLIILLVLVLTGCKTLQLERPVRVQSTDWWTTGGSESHNSAVDADVAPPLTLAWEYNALAAFGPGSPLVLGNAVLVANLQGEVHAINLETGKRIGQVSFREAINATPALVDERIIVANALGNRTLQAYDLERASTAWTRRGATVEAGLLAYGDAVLVADALGKVSLVNERNGEDIWTFEDPDQTNVRATPLMAGDLFVVIHQEGTARAFEPATGEVVWEADMGGPVYASPAAAGAIVYVPTTRGVMLAVNARTGRIEWRFDTNSERIRLASPSIKDGVIYFGASDGFVRAISTNFGEPRWRAQMSAAINAQVLVAGHYIYVGTMHNKLVALDYETGGEVWSTELRGRIKSAMAVAGGGIVVLTEPRYVYMFMPEVRNVTQ